MADWCNLAIHCGTEYLKRAQSWFQHKQWEKKDWAGAITGKYWNNLAHARISGMQLINHY